MSKSTSMKNNLRPICNRNYKLAGVVCLLFTFWFFVLPAQAKYGGGTGEPNTPYLIADANHMQAIGADSNDWDKHFLLVNDIDLSGFTGEEFNIIGDFSGVFDGNNHTISNFTYNSTGTDYIGIFGYVDGASAEIRNLGLVDPNIDLGTGDYAGSLAGRCYRGNISGCYVKGGSISGDGYAIGGLVGRKDSDGVVMSDCYATCDVRGGWICGGLAGENLGLLTNCYATGDVLVTAVGAGGLVGLNHGAVFNSYATGNVSGGNDSWRLGGLVGVNANGGIINCYSIGDVTGGVDSGAHGGLVGSNGDLISNCYSVGYVNGSGAYVSSFGGLVGLADGGWYTSSFWDNAVNPDVNGIGNTSDPNVIGKSTAEMQTKSTFTDAGWDFATPVWKMVCEGCSYPELAWQEVKYGGGSGEPNDPYLICEPNHMQAIGADSNDWDKHFLLMADIDLSSYTGTQFNIIGTFIPPALFTGTFDGNGHKISNFTYKSPDAGYVGIFGAVGGPDTEAEIKNLTLVDPNVDVGSGGDAGSLVGFWFRVGTLSDCAVIGGSVKGIGGVGGLLGSNMYGNVIRCSSSADVTATTTEFGPAGGLIGINNFGSVSLCYSAGNVTSSNVAGGLIGAVGGSGSNTVNCYSMATVTGPDFVGGLVGYNGSPITNCYSVGSVSGPGDYVSGLVGATSGPVTASFWDVNTSGQSGPWAGTDLTTVEMQTESTFTSAGWDFVGEIANGPNDIWDICDGTNYPKLAWQIPLLGDFVCPDGVEMSDLAVLVGQWLLEKLSADTAGSQGDGFVNFLDWAVFANGWQSTTDVNDLAVFVGQWLQAGAYNADIAPVGSTDGMVNMADFGVLAGNWLAGL